MPRVKASEFDCSLFQLRSFASCRPRFRQPARTEASGSDAGSYPARHPADPTRVRTLNRVDGTVVTPALQQPLFWCYSAHTWSALVMSPTSSIVEIPCRKCGRSLSVDYATQSSVMTKCQACGAYTTRPEPPFAVRYHLFKSEVPQIFGCLCRTYRRRVAHVDRNRGCGYCSRPRTGVRNLVGEVDTVVLALDTLAGHRLTVPGRRNNRAVTEEEVAPVGTLGFARLQSARRVPRRVTRGLAARHVSAPRPWPLWRVVLSEAQRSVGQTRRPEREDTEARCCCPPHAGGVNGVLPSRP